MDNDLDRKNTTTDEEEALRSLDDTTVRPLPEVSAVWEPLEAPVERPASGLQSCRRTLALMGAVAIVSFMAGGFTARLSAQMPVLFAKAPESTEVTASYEQPEASVDNVQEFEQAEPDPEPELEPEPEYSDDSPSYDVGYDTRDHSWGDSDKHKDRDDDDDEDDGEPELRWNLDDQGDRTISYDNVERRVTLDYDDYLFSFTLDGLLNSESDKQEQNTYNDYEYTPSPRRNSDSWLDGWYGIHT